MPDTWRKDQANSYALVPATAAHATVIDTVVVAVPHALCAERCGVSLVKRFARVTHTFFHIDDRVVRAAAWNSTHADTIRSMSF